MIMQKARVLFLASIVSICLTGLALTTCFAEESSTKLAQLTPFDYDSYTDLMSPIPNSSDERLQGLDKSLMNLWRQEKLQVQKEGHMLSGDFNGDGVADDSILLEKDSDEDPAGKDVWIAITTKKDGTRKLLCHKKLPGAHASIISFSWDADKHEFAIDTGKRVTQTETLSSVGGSGFKTQTDQTRKEIILVSWNPKKEEFDVHLPSTAKTKHKSS